MCNDYEQHVLWAEYCRMMASLALKIPSHQTELDLPQADDVRINDPAPIMRAADDTIELASMTFGFPPTGPRAPCRHAQFVITGSRVENVGIAGIPVDLDCPVLERLASHLFDLGKVASEEGDTASLFR